MKHAGVVVAGLALACSHHHHARVHSAELGPPPIAMVPHSSRLWIELEGTPDRQCEQTATERALCFAEIQAALGSAFTRTLWPSFPDVAVKTKGDDVEPGDYLLHVRLRVDSHPPDATGPGHAASIRGSWQLVRDGLPLAGESVSSRSRGDFAYGRPLGGAAGEVVDAVALHVASVIGTLPELRPAAQRPLPAVSTRKRTGALLGSAAASCQSSDDAKRCSMASR
ncbi:MAG: hypothetical protein L6Q84_17010 [Polyangiaceae bacterium]|nr:hypothetical protein [Polyangiaceae bacterium]